MRTDIRQHCILTACIVLLIAAQTVPAAPETTGTPDLEHDHDHTEHAEESLPAHHRASDEIDHGPIAPEYSIVGNFLAEFTNNKENSNRNRIRAREVEAAFQAYLLGDLRVNLVGALEQGYHLSHSKTEFHLEEAYLSLFDLPFGTEASVGRRLVEFGSLNATHLHERPFADTPLVLANFFGEHSWYDETASVAVPFDISEDTSIRASFTYIKARNFAHKNNHGHHGHHEPVEWQNDTYLTRILTKTRIDKQSSLDAGYSFAFDRPATTNLHGFDLTYHRYFTDSPRKITWQSELLYADIHEADIESFGFYSMLNFTCSDKWDIGARYDYSQALSHEDEYEWALSPFVTYHFDESLYARVQYRYREMLEDHTPENTVFLQLVWELGNHSHNH